MTSLTKAIYLLITFLFISPIFAHDIDLSFAKKEIIENEDLCLRRPYHNRAEPLYFFPVVRAKLKETVVSNYSSYILKEGLYKQKEGNVANPPNPVIIKDNLQGWLYKSLAHFVCNEKYRRFIDEELGVPVIDKVRLDNTPPKKGLDNAYDNDDDIDGSQDESIILDFEATDTEDKGINPRTQMRRWLKLCSDETQIILNLKFFEEYDEQGYPIRPRWELVASHTARRSCITNMYLSQKFTVPQMMSVSGHKTETMFYKYVKLSLDGP